MKTIKLLALDIDGVLTDGRTTLGARSPEKKRLAFQDLDAIGTARRAGLRLALITGESDGSVDLVATRTGVPVVRRDAKDKLAALQSVAKDARVSLAEICYVGDGDRDAPALAQAGFALAPANATFAARGAAHRVLKKSGGHGAVSEAVRLLLNRLADGRNEKIIRRDLRGYFQKHKIPLRHLPAVAKLAHELARAFQAGRKILLCGEGAESALQALSSSQWAWPILELSRDPALRAKQILAVARPGDLVVEVGGAETDSAHHAIPSNMPDVLELALHGRRAGVGWRAAVEAAEAILAHGPA